MKCSTVVTFFFFFFLFSVQSVLAGKRPAHKQKSATSISYFYTIQTNLEENVVWEKFAVRLLEMTTTGSESIKVYDSFSGKQLDSAGYNKKKLFRNPLSKEQWEAEHRKEAYQPYLLMCMACLDIRIEYRVEFSRHDTLVSPDKIFLIVQEGLMSVYDETVLGWVKVEDIVAAFAKDTAFRWMDPLNTSRSLSLVEQIYQAKFRSKKIQIRSKEFNASVSTFYDSLAYDSSALLTPANNNYLAPIQKQMRDNGVFYSQGDSCERAELQVEYGLSHYIREPEQRDSAFQERLDNLNLILSWIQYGVRKNRIPVYWVQNNSRFEPPVPQSDGYNEYTPWRLDNVALFVSYTFLYGKGLFQLSEITKVSYCLIDEGEGCSFVYVKYSDLEKYVQEEYEGMYTVKSLKNVFRLPGQVVSIVDKNGSEFDPNKSFSIDGDYNPPNYIYYFSQKLEEY